MAAIVHSVSVGGGEVMSKGTLAQLCWATTAMSMDVVPFLEGVRAVTFGAPLYSD